MTTNHVVSDKWIMPRLQVDSWQEVIQQLGGLLVGQDVVKESYIKAVLERETVFPTGLPLGKINVAIPHTDTRHVQRPAIAVATLAKPVLFGNMGEPGSELAVQIVFLLAMTDPQAQVGLLQSLVAAFQNGEVLERLLQAAMPEDIVRIMTEQLVMEEAS